MLLELCIAWVRHRVTIVVLSANSVRDRNIREAGMEPHFLRYASLSDILSKCGEHTLRNDFSVIFTL